MRRAARDRRPSRKLGSNNAPLIGVLDYEEIVGTVHTEPRRRRLRNVPTTPMEHKIPGKTLELHRPEHRLPKALRHLK